MWEWYTQRMKIRATLTIVGVIFLSMIMSCQEFRYKVWGKTIDASLVETNLEKTRRGGMKRVARYTFNDGDSFRQEYATVDMDWEGQNERTVKIQYLPNKDRMSRIVGQSNNVGWVIIFFVSLAAGIGWVLVMAYKK